MKEAKDDTDAQRPQIGRSLFMDDLVRMARSGAPIAMSCVAILAIIYTMYFAADFFLPILIAIFLAITLRPIVRFLKRRAGLPEPAGALVIVISVIVAIGAVGLHLAGPAQEWAERVPRLQQEIRAKLWPVRKSLQQAQEATKELQDLADGQPETETSRRVVVQQPSFLSRAFRSTWFTAAQVLITLVLAYFLLAQDEQTTRRNINRLPLGSRRASTEKAIDAVQITVTRYLQVSAVIYACLGAATALAMYLLKMPNPLLWGLMAMVLGFMPYVGPLITTTCIAVVALVTFDHWLQIVAPPLAYAVMSIIEGNFITPTILGRQLTLSPIAVFLSMLLWTWILGVLGALLAVPILVALTIIARHVAQVMREGRAPQPAAAPGPAVPPAEAAGR